MSNCKRDVVARDRDETETFEKYVSRLSRDRDVETETTTLLATALIHSRLDYCNSILHGTSASNFQLQVVQNALARTVSRSPLSVSASHLLSNLLPVRKQIDFKIATLAYKVLSPKRPAYLHNLISYRQPSHVLCSSSQLLLEVPRTKTEFCRRAFSSAWPQM